jgi:hypothetical protein
MIHGSGRQWHPPRDCHDWHFVPHSPDYSSNCHRVDSCLKSHQRTKNPNCPRMPQGRNAGCRGVVGVLTSARPVTDWGKYRQTHTIPSIADLPDLIEREYL